jgi:hypothetical protein
MLWRSIALLMQEKEHLNLLGINMILSYYCTLNLGSSKNSRSMEPDSGLVITSDSKSLVEQEIIHFSANKPSGELNPYWVSGYVAGEGSFYVNVRRTNTSDILIKNIFF